MCWTCFEKASLVQIRRKIGTKPVFLNNFNHVGDVLKKSSLVQIFLRIWTKLAFSNNLKVDQTCLLTRDHKFRREIKWTKLAFSKQVQHVILNSFKHFSGPKYKTLGSKFHYPFVYFNSYGVFSKFFHGYESLTYLNRYFLF